MKWHFEVGAFFAELRIRLMAAICYIGILCFIPLLYNCDSEFINFHARQGLVLWIWAVIAIFALFVLEIELVTEGSAVVIGLMSAYGMLASILRKKWRLPLVSRLSERL